jgi:hypothetical protein
MQIICRVFVRSPIAFSQKETARTAVSGCLLLGCKLVFHCVQHLLRGLLIGIPALLGHLLINAILHAKALIQRVVKSGDRIKAGAFEVEFVSVNHSISGACALAVRTPCGLIYHSGDFKIDLTPVAGEPIDLKRISELGISISFDENALDYLAREGTDRVYGARPLRRTIVHKVEDGFASALLEGRFASGDTVSVTADENGLVWNKSEK